MHLQAHSCGCQQALEYLLPSTPMAVHRPQDSGCWPDISVLATWALHGAAHNMAPCLLQSKVSQSEPPKQKPVFFYNLILGVISHYFCHIVLLRNPSLNPAYFLGEEITEWLAYQEVGGSLWVILEVAHHTIL